MMSSSKLVKTDEKKTLAAQQDGYFRINAGNASKCKLVRSSLDQYLDLYNVISTDTGGNPSFGKVTEENLKKGLMHFESPSEIGLFGAINRAEYDNPQPLRERDLPHVAVEISGRQWGCFPEMVDSDGSRSDAL